MDIEKYIILTDQQLISMSLDGDPVAFEHLFNRYRDSVKQLFAKKTEEHAEQAEDLLQETFVKVYLNLDKYNPVFTFGQWLYTIARNTMIDQIRKKQDNLFLENVSAGTRNPSSDILNPEELFINRQQRAELDRFLEKMTPRYRKLIELRFLKDYSYEEIAEELSIPLGTVKTRIHRAREQICRMIREQTDILQ